MAKMTLKQAGRKEHASIAQTCRDTAPTKVSLAPTLRNVPQLNAPMVRFSRADLKLDSPERASIVLAQGNGISEMNLSDLAFWLSEIVADFVDIDGRIFIDRSGEGIELLRQRASEYETLANAQQWMNIVPIDAFLDEVAGKGWEVGDPGVEEILAVYAKAWTYQIQARFPDAGLAVQVLEGDDDVGLKLIQA